MWLDMPRAVPPSPLKGNAYSSYCFTYSIRYNSGPGVEVKLYLTDLLVYILNELNYEVNKFTFGKLLGMIICY